MGGEEARRIGPMMEYFSVIPDPRKEINRKYPLYEVIAITILARSDTETKSSVVGRIKQMAWSESYLEQLLFASRFASQPST